MATDWELDALSGLTNQPAGTSILNYNINVIADLSQYRAQSTPSYGRDELLLIRNRASPERAIESPWDSFGAIDVYKIMPFSIRESKCTSVPFFIPALTCLVP